MRAKDIETKRCTIIGKSGRCFIGKDVFGTKYTIEKSRATKRWEIGDNFTFYCFSKIVKVLFWKKKVLVPITETEYNELRKDTYKPASIDPSLRARLQKCI